MAKEKEINNLESRQKMLGQLWWLIDAPLFIDRNLTHHFHDAIIHPTWQLTNKSEAEDKSETEQIAADLKIGGGIKGPSILDFLGFNAEIKAEAKISLQSSSSSSSGETQNFTKIVTSERKLLEIIGFYLKYIPGKIQFSSLPNNAELVSAEQSQDIKASLQTPPRPLVFIDIDPKVPIMPTASESIDGKYTLIYQNIVKRLWLESEMESAPNYPNDEERDDTNRKQYWHKLFDRYQSHIAMEEVENAAQKFGRFEWVDFQVKSGNSGETYHLHCNPLGAYSSGVFGYNFIGRGFKHGVRIVGTLRAGNSVNVLAIYER